jgi:hypothetical protein
VPWCTSLVHSTFVAPSSESRVTPLRADHKETLLYHAAQSGRKAPIYFSSVATPRRAPHKVGRPSKQASGNLALGQMLQKVPRFGRLTCSQSFWLSRGRSVADMSLSSAAPTAPSARQLKRNKR